MRAIFINLLKGFWLSKGKLFLCVLASVLSAWGISAVIYSYAMSERDFKENFAWSNQADIIITVTDSTGAIQKLFASEPGIVDVEQREVVTGRIKNSSGNWMSFLLHAAVDLDSPRMSKFNVVERGTDSTGSILIEKNGFNFLNTEDGKMTIEFPGHVAAEFHFGGFVRDPGLPPSQMEQTVYGFTTISSIEYLLKKNRKTFLIKTDLSNPTVDQLKASAKQLDEVAKSAGSNLNQIIVPPPGEHQHQNIVDSLALLQRSFGLVLSMLGVILLSLILITWLYPQISNIGIMKAIGASTHMISKGYFLVLLFIIFMGLIFGLPLGYKTAKFYSGFIAFVQNFQVVDRPLSILTHLAVILPTLILPILFAFMPMRKAARTTVHNALSSIFYTPYKRIFKYTQGLSSSKIKYGVNNLFRSTQRTLLMITLLVIGISLFTGGTNLKYSLKTDFDKFVNDSGYNITVLLKDSMQGNLAYIDTLSFVKSISYVHLSKIRFVSPNKSFEENSQLKTFSPGYNLSPDYVINGNLKPDCIQCVYFSQQYKADFEGVELGDEIQLIHPSGTPERFTFSGIIKDIGYKGFYRFAFKPNSSYKEIALNISDIELSKAILKLDDALLANDIDVIKIGSAKERLVQLDNHLEPTYGTIQYMGICTIAIALFGMLIVLNISMQERAREMGIMKALGGSVGSIVRLFHYEFIICTTLAIVLGSAVGYILNSIICNLFGVMVIEVPVVPLIDLKSISMAMLGLLVVQFLMIELYGRFMVKRSSATLLNHVF